MSVTTTTADTNVSTESVMPSASLSRPQTSSTPNSTFLMDPSLDKSILAGNIGESVKQKETLVPVVNKNDGCEGQISCKDTEKNSEMLNTEQNLVNGDGDRQIKTNEGGKTFNDTQENDLDHMKMLLDVTNCSNNNNSCCAKWVQKVNFEDASTIADTFGVTKSTVFINDTETFDLTSQSKIKSKPDQKLLTTQEMDHMNEKDKGLNLL